MTKEQSEFLARASECYGSKCDIRSDYSGRRMYGKTTYAVVVDSVTQLLADCLNYIQKEISNGETVIIPEFVSFREDSMGMDRVVIY